MAIIMIFHGLLLVEIIEKLEKVKDNFNLPSDIGMMIVDSNDQASIDAMVSQTKCVLTTVGPYQLYGEKIITSCISSGTDYVDLCGEPGFMHKIISEHSEEAKQKGSRIVFSCGFDSIPFDLGSFICSRGSKGKVQ